MFAFRTLVAMCLLWTFSSIESNFDREVCNVCTDSILIAANWQYHHQRRPWKEINIAESGLDQCGLT